MIKEITISYEDFVKLYQEKSEQSGKFLEQSVTGYRVLDIIKEVFEEVENL